MLLKVLSVHAGPHAAQVPIPYIPCTLSEHDHNLFVEKAYQTNFSLILSLCMVFMDQLKIYIYTFIIRQMLFPFFFGWLWIACLTVHVSLLLAA